eukprot:8100566-Alexandrium_andersonii.AAC.1
MAAPGWDPRGSSPFAGASAALSIVARPAPKRLEISSFRLFHHWLFRVLRRRFYDVGPRASAR